MFIQNLKDFDRTKNSILDFEVIYKNYKNLQKSYGFCAPGSKFLLNSFWDIYPVEVCRFLRATDKYFSFHGLKYIHNRFWNKSCDLIKFYDL